MRIPIGDEREFTVQCHACQKLSVASIDTGGEPLIVAEGLPEWRVVEPPELPRAAVPPKKRQKSAPVVPVEDDVDDVDDAEDEGEEIVLVAASVPHTVTATTKGNRPSSKVKPTAARPKSPQPSKLAQKPRASDAMAPRRPSSKGTKLPAAPLPAALVRTAVVKYGSIALAQFHDGYYYSGVIEGFRVREGHARAALGCTASRRPRRSAACP